MSVAHHLVDLFNANRDRIAIVDARGASTTYRTLLEETARMQAHLRQANLPAGSRVILATPRGVPFTVAALSLLLEGHIAVGIELAQGDDVYRDRAGAMGAAAVMTSPIVRRLQAVDPLRRGLARVAPIPPKLDLHSIECPAPSSVPRQITGVQNGDSVDEETVALIVFTGGTTSAPKGVRLSHRAIRAYLDGLNQLPEWAGLESIVADHPQQVLYGVAHGKTVYLSKARPSARARHIAKLLFEEGVHGYFGAPTTWASILDHGAHQEPGATHPKAILLGGAPVTLPLLERLDAELGDRTSVRCLYGMTELGLVAHTSSQDKRRQLRSNIGDPVGELLPTVTASLGDDGELLLSGPSRFSGYVGEPLVPADTPFATGDFASISNRRLSLLGRKKDMILHDGVNLYPAQYTHHLLALQHNAQPAFRDVALIGVPTGQLANEKIVLCYTSDAPLPQLRATELANTVLPAAHPVSTAIRLDAMPTSGRQNKVDRHALRALAVDRPDAGESDALAQLQRELFGRLTAVSPRSPKRIALHTLARINLRASQRSPQAHGTVNDPVVILGHQRSGTTTVHRALSAAPGATAMPLIDMIAPHATGWRLASITHRLARFGRRGRHSRLGEINEMHPLSLFDAEEQEFLFAAWGVSGFLPSIFEGALGDITFDRFRDRSRWPEGALDALLDLHDRTVNSWRSHRRIAPLDRLVIKNPALGPAAHRLATRWPQATFVVMLRDPADAIESRLRLIATVNGRQLNQSEIDVVVADSQRQMQGLALTLGSVPAERVRHIWFDDLVADPNATIETLADFCKLGPPPKVDRKPCVTSPRKPTLSRADIDAAVPDFRALVDKARAESMRAAS